MKIYTKTGDKGKTSLYDGSRIDKASLRVESYGTIDELNSYIGLACKFIDDEKIAELLLEIQQKLFFVAGELATIEKDKYAYKIRVQDVNDLENIIDYYLPKIEGIDKFIIPGSSKSSATLHVARTICRRAERRMLSLNKEEEISDTLIKFINRLSDVLYTFARYLETNLKIMDFDKIYNKNIK